MNDEYTGRDSTIREDEGEPLTGRMPANTFVNNYEDVRNIHVDRKQQREARREQNERTTTIVTSERTCRMLTLHEL